MQIPRSRSPRPGLLNAAATTAATAVAAAVAATALAFAGAPAAFAAAPAVSLSPATGLTDGQPLTVSGTGFTPGAQIGVAQCTGTTRCSDAFVIAVADATGAFTVEHRVYRTFWATDLDTGTSADADCAVRQCQVVAWQEATGPAGADITFS